MHALMSPHECGGVAAAASVVTWFTAGDGSGGKGVDRGNVRSARLSSSLGQRVLGWRVNQGRSVKCCRCKTCLCRMRSALFALSRLWDDCCGVRGV